MGIGQRPLPTRVERRNATFQQWHSLLHSRKKRTRDGEVLVQGVRPITQALVRGHDIRVILSDGRPRQSAWARDVLTRHDGPVVTVAPGLMEELGERDDGPPELLAVVRVPPDDLEHLPVPADSPLVVLDRLGSPGNIGSICRSVDALGGAGLVTTGHSADPWDPASIRASTGSIFAVPVVRQPSAGSVLSWVRERRREGTPLTVVGLDEDGSTDLSRATLTGPVVLVIGSEATGLSAAWRQSCDRLVKIPMTGSATSLNAANAASIALYEAARQRQRHHHPEPPSRSS